MDEQQSDNRRRLRYVSLSRRFPLLLKPSAIANAAQRLAFGPSFSLHKPQSYYETILQEFGRTPCQSFDHYQEELKNDPCLKRVYVAAVESNVIRQKYKNYDDRFQNVANIVPYYAYVREVKPDFIVETGTGSGSMTSWLLAALARNGSGQLISIDIPPVAGRLTMSRTLEPEEVGFLVPQEYRSAWRLIQGDARNHLPAVLAENPVTMFIHDSLHTRTHMLFEYSVARSFLPEGAAIISDDIMWNNSFFAFVEAHHLRGYGCISNPNVGICVNRRDALETRMELER